MILRTIATSISNISPNTTRLQPKSGITIWHMKPARILKRTRSAFWTTKSCSGTNSYLNPCNSTAEILLQRMGSLDEGYDDFGC